MLHREIQSSYAETQREWHGRSTKISTHHKLHAPQKDGFYLVVLDSSIVVVFGIEKTFMIILPGIVTPQDQQHIEAPTRI